MRAHPLEVGDFGLTDHLQAMRMEKVEVADLIDGIGRWHRRLAIAARSPADPGQIENAGRVGDEFADRQASGSQVDIVMGIGAGLRDCRAARGGREGHPLTLHPRP